MRVACTFSKQLKPDLGILKMLQKSIRKKKSVIIKIFLISSKLNKLTNNCQLVSMNDINIEELKNSNKKG